MAIGAFIPLVFFVVILGSVGVRLVALWHRTRQTPELALGAGLLIVSLSMPLSAVGRLPATAMEPIGRACFAAGLFAVALGISLTVYFNYYVFRRGSGWARVLLLAISSLLFAAVAYMSIVQVPRTAPLPARGRLPQQRRSRTRVLRAATRLPA